MESSLNKVKSYLLNLQSSICEGLEIFEPEKKFITDEWQRPTGGGGKTRVIEGGQTFEKGGVNFSHVYGDAMPASATAHRPELAGARFNAMGVSLVIHPNNPYVPTSHANVRLFVAEKEGQDPIWWFGGGYDLTPYYGFEEDVTHWHNTAKNACESFGESIYPEFKAACDKYFFLKHRNEARGVGGLFFDDLNRWDFETCFKFIQAIGNSYLEAVIPIIEKRKDMIYGEREIEFQRYRRGRYVEFNLVYDRGTLFGLQSGGRTESILMSLPAHVDWRYDWTPESHSKEAELYTKFLPIKEWI